MGAKPLKMPDNLEVGDRVFATGYIQDLLGLTRYELEITVLEKKAGRGKKTASNWYYIADCKETIPETPHPEIKGRRLRAVRKFKPGEEYDSIKVIRKEASQ